MNENEAHDGRVESSHVAAVDAITPLDVAALHAVGAIQELRDLDLDGAQLVGVALVHRVVAIRDRNLHVGVGGLAGVGLDLLVKQLPEALAQALSARTGRDRDAEGARVRPGRRGRRVGENRVDDASGDLAIREGAGRATGGNQGRKFVLLFVEGHAPMPSPARRPRSTRPTYRTAAGLPGQSLLEGRHVLLRGRPGGADAHEEAPVGQRLPDAVLNLAGEPIMPGMIEGDEGQVRRRFHRDDVPRPRQGRADPSRGLDRRGADAHVQVVLEKRLELDPEQAPLGQERTVLLHLGDELTDRSALGDHHGLAEEGAIWCRRCRRRR